MKTSIQQNHTVLVEKWFGYDVQHLTSYPHEAEVKIVISILGNRYIPCSEEKKTQERCSK